jgi:hypothetical protein
VSEERRAENSIWDMNWEEKCTYNRGNEWKTSNYFYKILGLGSLLPWK